MNLASTISKKNTFIRYIASLTIAFLIPVLVLGFVTYKYFFNIFEQEVLTKNIELLEKSKSATEIQFGQILSIPLQLQNDRLFTTGYYLDNFSYFTDMEARLRSMKGIYGIVHDILFYRAGDEFIVSSIYGKTELNFFTQSICQYKYWPAGEMVKTINQPSSTFIWRGSEEIMDNYIPQSIITYIYYNNSFDVVFIVQIDSQRFNAFVQDTFNNGGNTVILDRQGNMIHSTMVGTANIDNTIISKIIQDEHSSAYLPGNGTNRNHLYYTKSSLTGFIYFREIPYHYAAEKVDVLKNILLITLGILLIISMVLIYALARSNYRPIQQLGVTAKSLFTSPGVPDDDIGRAKYVMENLSQINRDIISASQKPIKEFMLLKLLRGAYDSIEEFNQEGRHIGLKLEEAFFRIALIVLKENQVAKDFPLISHEDAEIMLLQEINSNCIEGIDPSSFIMIFSYRDENQLKEKLKNLKQKLDMRNFSCCCGIGNEIHDIRKMFDSYTKAKLALQYVSLNNQDNIVFFDEVNSSDTIDGNYPKLELDSLYKSIQDGNAAKLDFILEDLNRWIKLTNKSFFLSVCMGFDIINTMLKAVKEKGWEMPKNLLSKDLKFSLTELNNIDHIIEYIHNIGNEIIFLIQSMGIQKNCSFSRKVKDHVYDRISDPNLSIQSIADDLNISISNLSHQFKKDSGENISDIITNLRMEKAKEMLQQTTITLPEISASLGYNQVSSFVRKFKQVEGITPGKYRQKYSCIPD